MVWDCRILLVLIIKISYGKIMNELQKKYKALAVSVVVGITLAFFWILYKYVGSSLEDILKVFALVCGALFFALLRAFRVNSNLDKKFYIRKVLQSCIFVAVLWLIGFILSSFVSLSVIGYVYIALYFLYVIADYIYSARGHH